MQRLLVDMDDVLADTGGKMLQLYNDAFDAGLTKADFVGKSWYEVIDPLKYQKVNDMVFQPGFFADLAVYEHAPQVMKRLYAAYDLYIVSAAVEFPNSLKEKITWLANYFPFISWKKIVFCGDKSVTQGDIMIDDHIKNLSKFQGRTLMYDAIHNQDVTDHQRVKSWKEIESILL